jgi:preprotein translocase subunit SecG
VLRGIDGAIQSAGLVVLLLAALTLFGLTGTKGRLTRTGAVLALVFMIAFFVALIVRAENWDVGLGAIAIAVGAITAFVGGLFARR